MVREPVEVQVEWMSSLSKVEMKALEDMVYKSRECLDGCVRRVGSLSGEFDQSFFFFL